MSHLVLPGTFPGQKTLLSAIITKHTADGVSSPLIDYLIQNNIDFVDMAKTATYAETLEQSRVVLALNSQNYTQLMLAAFELPVAHLKMEVQFLKKLYKGNEKELGSWGIDVQGTGKIVYPNTFEEMAATITTFLAYQVNLAKTSSPLTIFLTKQGIDITADAASVAAAVDYHNKSKAAANQSQTANQQLTAAWSPVVTSVHGIGNFLLSYYGSNTKAIGAHGFVVDDTAAKAKTMTSTIKLQDKITLKGVIIGSTLVNLSADDIHLYKGKTTTGNPIIIPAGGKFGVPKGHSTLTVSNPSLLTSAKVSTLRIA